MTTSPIIAIIDDDTVVPRLLRDVLTEEGYDVRVFPHGDAAVPHLRALLPTVTIFDIDDAQSAVGWARLARLRQDPALSARPLIVCASAQELAENGPPHDGGYATLVKPFDLDELLGLVAHVTTPDDR